MKECKLEPYIIDIIVLSLYHNVTQIWMHNSG